MSLTEDERVKLAQMLDTSADLDRWRRRVRAVEEPESESELAIDDKIFPCMEISQLARFSLASAGEHLRLALGAIEARQLYPSSHFTVLRGALVGASQSVWILESDDRDRRQERGLTVLAKMYAEMDKYYNFLDTNELAADDRAKLHDQRMWLRERSDDLALKRRNKASLNLTEVIGAAAEYTFADTASRHAVRRIWREMSADAHVLGWSLFQRSEFGSPDPRTGIGEAKAPGNIRDIGEPFLISYRLLRRGWSLFDRRCEDP